MMAQSISPVRSISSSLTVKFSCSMSGICGVRGDGIAHQVGQQVGADGVDDAERQRAGQRILSAPCDLANASRLLQHRLRLPHDFSRQAA